MFGSESRNGFVDSRDRRLRVLNFTVIAPERLHRSNKAITATRNSLNVNRAASVITQRLPELLNIKGQIRLFNKCVGPKALHQFFFQHNPATVLN